MAFLSWKLKSGENHLHWQGGEGGWGTATYLWPVGFSRMLFLLFQSPRPPDSVFHSPLVSIGINMLKTTGWVHTAFRHLNLGISGISPPSFKPLESWAWSNPGDAWVLAAMCVHGRKSPGNMQSCLRPHSCLTPLVLATSFAWTA